MRGSSNALGQVESSDAHDGHVPTCGIRIPNDLPAAYITHVFHSHSTYPMEYVVFQPPKRHVFL